MSKRRLAGDGMVRRREDGRWEGRIVVGHKNYIKLYIKPQLGSKKISSITTEDVQRMYTKLKKSGQVRKHPKYDHQLSDAMICHIHCTLHHALDDAVAARLIP